VTDKLVLKENQVFMVSLANGDIPETDQEGSGMYYKDTRYLSLLELRVNGYEPAVLNSSGEFNFMGNIQSANPLMQLPNPRDASSPLMILPRSISIRRNRFIEDGMHERLGLFNYNSFPVDIEISIRFGCDFRDMFDVRGYNRLKRGQVRTPEFNGQHIHFSYMGLDNIERYTEIVFDQAPSRIEAIRGVEIDTGQVLAQRASLPHATETVPAPKVEAAVAVAYFKIRLEPNVPLGITYHVVPQKLGNGENTLPTTFDMGARRMRVAYEEWREESTRLRSDNELFDSFIERSCNDLRILTEDLPTGLFPVAGIPWFAVPFGRDSLITALQTLVFNPQLAIGTLRFLAQYQGKKENSWNEEQPGKILHELRAGEMTVLGEMPHVPYFGSIDSTPLFLMLFAETMRWLNDDSLYTELIENVRAALAWIDNYGDIDGDGFLEYVCSNARGVKNHGWKDSSNAILWEDGRPPEQPIALCEPQAYVYAAKVGVAELLERKGERDWAKRLREEAHELKRKFNQMFWLPDINFYAHALDKRKRPVPQITSNVGHCLWCKIIDEDKAEKVVKVLSSPEMSSGWGLRTLSTADPHYNPMSYHNGSVWPHDNSLISMGMKRYGFNKEAISVVSQVFSAAERFRYMRLPELFCGFPQDKRYSSNPAEYPVSCSPQAWTAGAGLLFIQIILGLEVDAKNKTVTLSPHFPDFLNEVSLDQMKVGDKLLSFKVKRSQDHQYAVEIGRSGRFQFLLVSE
jgi:glycogen debranching enzyme